jgi:hypothetical protein
MKVRIELNEQYAQKLLQNDEFLFQLSCVVDDADNFTEFWVENQIVNNDEATFKALTLQLIKNHFCEIFKEEAQNVEITTTENFIPNGLFRHSVSKDLRSIVRIIDFTL